MARQLRKERSREYKNLELLKKFGYNKNPEKFVDTLFTGYEVKQIMGYKGRLGELQLKLMTLRRFFVSSETISMLGIGMTIWALDSLFF